MTVRQIQSKRLPHVGLLCGASAFAAIASLVPSSAFAQTSAAAAATAPAPQDQAPGTASSDTTGDIVVTAQKREERLQDVPISVSVLGGKQLDQSTAKGVSEQLALIPGFSLAKSTYSGGGLISVRGVSAARTLFGGANPVAYYLDSVPFGFVQSSVTPDADAYDLSRIEALRGPQGTLYGANALAGVVRVLTNDPNLDRFEMKFRVGDSSTENGGNNYRGDLAVNIPLVDGKLAVRGVVDYQSLSGWIDTPIAKNANSSVSRSYRFKVGAQPTDDLSIVAGVWLNRESGNGISAGQRYNFRNATIDEPHDANYDMYSLKVNYDFHAFTFSSSTSYLKYNEFGVNDAAYRFGGLHAPLDFGFNAKTFSEEINLASEGSGPWRWSAGAFYRDGSDKGVVLSPIGIDLDWTNTSKSYAVFGEVTRLFANDTIEFTLGGRYFHDHVTTVEDHDIAPVNPAGYYRATGNYSAATPRVVLSWHPERGLTAYASYSQGFRSGSPQAYYTVAGKPGFPDVKPDKLFNYEVGFKGDVGVFSFDAAVYYMKWKDIQQQVTVQYGNPPQAVAAIINGQSASGKGIDLSLRAHPLQGLDFGGSISWNDLATDSNIVDGGTVLFTKGDRLNNSPKYNANLFLNYGAEIGGGYKGTLSLSANYADKICSRTTVKGAAVIACGDSYWTSRAAFSLDSQKGWRLTAYVDNLNNFKGAVIGDPVWGPDYTTRLRPRTIGLQFEYHL